MTQKPVTVDNLGVESSIRYGENQKRFDPKYIEDAKIVPSYTEVVSSSPVEVPEFLRDYQADLKKISSWAAFPGVPSHLRPNKELFSHQAIPSLGSLETIESCCEKLEKIKEVFTQELKKNHQESKEQQDLQKIEELLGTIRSIDKILLTINSRRNQFHRG